MTMLLPGFDEIHVISDIHMGGRKGFQILKETDRLAAYIRWVAQQRKGEKTALILNGDIIDTLAENNNGYIAVENAESILNRIMTDPSFVCIWDALHDFVKTPDRTLVMVLGNHDLELSFPGVQQTIINKLAGDDPERRARIMFSTIGAGFACCVGDARIFCTHGNEVDDWNFNRYEDLSRLARRLNADRPFKASEWNPNAGTMMVKDIMNEVKKRYAWIDLPGPTHVTNLIFL